MNYHLRLHNNKHALFFYHGRGMKQQTSFVYKDGEIALFEEEYKAIQIGDKLKLGNPNVEEYKFEPSFLKAIAK